jgi:hypothetical protein
VKRRQDGEVRGGDVCVHAASHTAAVLRPRSDGIATTLKILSAANRR